MLKVNSSRFQISFKHVKLWINLDLGNNYLILSFVSCSFYQKKCCILLYFISYLMSCYGSFACEVVCSFQLIVTKLRIFLTQFKKTFNYYKKINFSFRHHFKISSYRFILDSRAGWNTAVITPLISVLHYIVTGNIVNQ